MTIHAYAAFDKESPLQTFEYEPRPLGLFDVEIAITHCGICHSDVHVIENGWGGFPRVPGHEIIGTVAARGDAVTHLEMGQRVGVGWQAGSCLDCEWCVSAHENLCDEQKATCIDQQGGFADRIIVDSRFAYPIPDSLSSENAAPLLCGGITVYAPLRQFGVTSASRVGVVGIGGLGHLALQFAAAFGCEVTAFSTTSDKEDEARSFGATRFILSTDAAQMKAARNSLDFILVTIHVNLDWKPYLRILRPNGALCFLGVIQDDLKISAMHLMDKQLSIHGGAIGSRSMTREMLMFAARHHIVAQTEVMPLSDVNAALEKVRNNQARYRMVLKV